MLLPKYIGAEATGGVLLLARGEHNANGIGFSLRWSMPLDQNHGDVINLALFVNGDFLDAYC